MNRDNIKIIEFGMEDDGPARSDPAEGPVMKILEFDGGPPESKARVATAKDIGHIKIIEFDDGPKPERRTEPEQQSRPRGPVRIPVKIKEFDDEREAIGPAAHEPKIKILEFD